MAQIQETAFEKSIQTDGTLDQNMYKELYTSGIHDMAQGIDALAKGQSEFSFGASSIVGAPIETVKNWMTGSSMEKQASPKAPVFHKITKP